MISKPVDTAAADISAGSTDGQQTDAGHELAMICKALAHPVRIRILQHLKKADGCICGRIVAMLPLAQSTVSQHLKILKEAGLVKGEVEGPRTCYCLHRQKLARLKMLVAGL